MVADAIALIRTLRFSSRLLFISFSDLCRALHLLPLLLFQFFSLSKKPRQLHSCRGCSLVSAGSHAFVDELGIEIAAAEMRVVENLLMERNGSLDAADAEFS